MRGNGRLAAVFPRTDGVSDSDSPSSEPAKRRRGRPRAASTDAALLQATLALGEEIGFDALTVEAIATRAGVARTTLYRRNRSVSAWVLDAFLYEVNRVSTFTEAETTRETFRVSMKRLAKAYNGRVGRLMRTLVARAQGDPDLLDAVRLRWVEPRRAMARRVIVAGMTRGELRQGLVPDIVLDALYGPFYHRMLVPYLGARLSAGYVDSLVDMVFDGIAADGVGADPVR